MCWLKPVKAFRIASIFASGIFPFSGVAATGRSLSSAYRMNSALVMMRKLRSGSSKFTLFERFCSAFAACSLDLLSRKSCRKSRCCICVGMVEGVVLLGVMESICAVFLSAAVGEGKEGVSGMGCCPLLESLVMAALMSETSLTGRARDSLSATSRSVCAREWMCSNRSLR